MATSERLGVDVIINNIDNNPACSHGPTVLFERFQSNGRSRQYYACSACRDRKDCSFFHWADEKFSKTKRDLWDKFIKDSESKDTEEELSRSLNEVLSVLPSERIYCASCSTLLTIARRSKHKACTLITPLTDIQLTQPSSFLPPRESAKKEAQYLFASSSVNVIINMLVKIQAKRVLCVGAPRIYEAIAMSEKLEMSALMLDIDERFQSFFKPQSFLRYNMFNHYFFDGKKAKETYQNFIAEKEKLVLVSDPPFGGRMELLAHNMKRIEQDWRTARHLDPQEQLPVLFIFPYFMEPQVLHNLSDFVMLDYQIDYDNHPLYSSGPKSMKNGSAVRVYVNQPASLFSFPESEGYHYCKPCNRWVFNNNKHCKKCKGCMSKDGRTYRHCDQCMKCVKPSWLHCTECSRCQPQDHKCKSQGVNGSSKTICHICGGSDHKRTDCPKKKKRGESFSSEHAGKKKKRRKQALPSNLSEERERNLDILSQIISS
ncbi:rRNA N6-adenosine-methyltransferase ZCCHC4 [Penaeus vannamei]|uniref:rRNA N6-adenosine-methyltransferase ZCCHC4 n=1 Tax=Penaeus vannamei TaxID=6689 RepID=UPI00387F4CCD